MDIILKYFPDLTEHQKEQFSRLPELYKHWNDQINVISRKDLDQLLERHVLHSLAIAKFYPFKAGTKILDVGCGGGFPSIPLAIMFPDVEFYAVDAIAKKIKVVNGVKEALGLTNIIAEQKRAEKVQGKFDFVVSRAVTRMNKFMPWVRNKVQKGAYNGFRNGYIFLKGGDLHEELSEVRNKFKSHDISSGFEEEFFETKKVLYTEVL